MKLAGNVSIVTGGAKGIGAGVVRQFVAEGAAVVIADKDAAAGQQVAAQFGKDNVWVFPLDVSNSQQVRELMSFTIDRGGRLDILVNNAGYHLSKNVEQTSDNEWDFILNTNLKSTFLCSKYAIPHLRRSKGCVVNISSMVALVGQSNAGAYSASKGGQLSMTRGMALDFAKDGIRVNAICPGWVQTPLVEDWFGQQADPAAARRYIDAAHPMGRIASADEIGRAAVFLASADAGFVTGVALPVEGGVTLGY